MKVPLGHVRPYGYSQWILIFSLDVELVKPTEVRQLVFEVKALQNTEDGI